jgi:hypothetical protein
MAASLGKAVGLSTTVIPEETPLGEDWVAGTAPR